MHDSAGAGEIERLVQELLDLGCDPEGLQDRSADWLEHHKRRWLTALMSEPPRTKE
jgi:hypothetical protein